MLWNEAEARDGGRAGGGWYLPELRSQENSRQTLLVSYSEKGQRDNGPSPLSQKKTGGSGRFLAAMST